ncbi:DMT family transporter [Streptomyces sp. NRRL S-1521]|uniref:DMT family transporter n=1 Tax=Streptomyces sp. NRRL S-1521 TaxID=1609100 RepID=UPI000B0E5E94|nr:DMT family transporter [Streptomyces sp. NRRL S-1521]
MSALALSVVLSLVSAVAYAGGAILQERVAATTPDQRYAPLRRASWWAAIALNGLGALLHVVALAYGPLSLVQPLGALTIVFALPMAAVFVRRKAGATAWRGAIMATVGLAGLLSLTSASGSTSLDGAERVMLALATGGGVLALTVAAHAAHRHPVVRSVLLACAAGAAFGIASVFTKTVAVDMDRGVALLQQLPSLGVIAVLAAAGVLISQASYRGAGLAAPLSTVTVVNPVVAAAVGLTLFEETFRYGTMGTALALGCGVVAAGGLILLTTERLAREAASGAEGSTVPETPAAPAVAAPEGLAAPAAVTVPEALAAPAVAGPDALAAPGAAAVAGAGQLVAAAGKAAVRPPRPVPPVDAALPGPPLPALPSQLTVAALGHRGVRHRQPRRPREPIGS